MQAKLKEMIMVIRPTSGNGLIAMNELDYILQQLGFEFLTKESDDLKSHIDQGGSGFFQQDELVDHLMSNYVQTYTNVDALRDAIKTFDYNNDGKIAYDEFEYFMKNFGESEAFYMDDNKIQTLLECAKPLDHNGNIEIERLVQNLTVCWKNINK